MKKTSRFRVFAAALVLASCGGDPEPNGADAASTDTQVDSAAETALDTLQADVAGPTELKWTAQPTGLAAKMRAIAAVPGSPGAYVLAGDDATVLRFGGKDFEEISPGKIGTSSLRAVWVAAEGDVFAAGTGSSLVVRDAMGWNVAGEIPTTPAVHFNALSGSSRTNVWAVGDAAAAWRFDGAGWNLAAGVTPTQADPQLAENAAFTCVFVRGPGDVWIGAGPGVAGGGVVLHGLAGTWQAWAVEQVPAAIWASEPVAALGGKPRVFVAGGSNEDYLAILEGEGSFVRQKNVWQLGFTGVSGASAELAWATAFKGQLRRYDKGAWSVESIKSPIGTPPGQAFSVTDKLVGIAVHAADERAVLAEFALYRWGQQPK